MHSVARLGPRDIRLVVDDPETVVAELPAALDRLGLAVSAVEDHVVGYDEAFVRLVERSRRARRHRGRRRVARTRTRPADQHDTPEGVTTSAPALREPDPTWARRRRPRGLWAPVIRSSAFVKKELAEILRQPRLLVLLVVGPFLLLLLFGAGYADDQLTLRTVFVGPEGPLYQDVVDRYAEDVDSLVDSRGYTTDEAGARRALEDEEVDLVVIFPADPVNTVLAGEQATIQVLHQQLDPLQETAVEVLSRLAVQEVNANVLASVVGQAQDRAGPAVELAVCGRHRRGAAGRQPAGRPAGPAAAGRAGDRPR